MADKRKNPIERAVARVDSAMMKRMPSDFQEMHKKRKEKKAGKAPNAG